MSLTALASPVLASGYGYYNDGYNQGYYNYYNTSPYSGYGYYNNGSNQGYYNCTAIATAGTATTATAGTTTGTNYGY